MNWAETIVQSLKDSEISLIAFVPDISIHQVTQLLEDDDYVMLPPTPSSQPPARSRYVQQSASPRPAPTPPDAALPSSCSPAASATASTPWSNLLECLASNH